MTFTASAHPTADQLDSYRAVRDVESRIAVEHDPRHRHMLGVFRDHLAGEAAADVDAVMATLIPEPRFRHFAFGVERTTQQGQAATHSHYSLVLGNPSERRLDRILVDDNTIFVDGINYMVMNGAQVTDLTDRVPDSSAERYMLRLRIATVVPFEGGLMAGEDNYGFWAGPPEDDWLTPI